MDKVAVARFESCGFLSAQGNALDSGSACRDPSSGVSYSLCISPSVCAVGKVISESLWGQGGPRMCGCDFCMASDRVGTLCQTCRALWVNYVFGVTSAVGVPFREYFFLQFLHPSLYELRTSLGALAQACLYLMSTLNYTAYRRLCTSGCQP